jgi:photosynthetic reaction center cytochrome c subunit
VKLYFDEQTGLLIRLVRYAASPLGVVPTQIDYSDYRDVAGVQTPFRWTVAQTDRSSTTQLEEVQPNVPIDDGRFSKPIASSPKSVSQ